MQQQKKNEMIKAYRERNGWLVSENFELKKTLETLRESSQQLVEQLRIANNEGQVRGEEIERLLAKLDVQAEELDQLRKITLKPRLQAEAEATVAQRQAERMAELDFAEMPVAELVEAYRGVSQSTAAMKAKVIVIAMESSGFSRHETSRAARWLLSAYHDFPIGRTEAHLVGKMTQGGDVAAIAECELVLMKFAWQSNNYEEVLEGEKACA